jgi:colicin import membrane protein
MAYVAAGVIHLLLIAAVLFNYNSDDKVEVVDAFDAETLDTVKASVIDESLIKDQQDKLKKAEAERERKKREAKQRELDELNRIKKLADEEKLVVDDLKAQQILEKEKADEQSRVIALKKQQEEEQRRLDEKKRKAEQLKRKKEKERQRKLDEAEEKRRLELQKELAKEEAAILQRQELVKRLQDEELERARIANERARDAERRAKQRTTTIVNRFFAGIQSKIEGTRTVDPSFETWRKSIVDITLSPSGEVRSVRTLRSSGLLQYDQSVESAIYNASPFDMPDRNTEPNAVNQLLNFELTVKHPRAR